MDLAQLRRNYAADRPQVRRLFAVMGWGCSASRWFAGVLSNCYGVFCLHEGRHILTMQEGPLLAAPEYMQFLASLASGAVAAGDCNSIRPSEIATLRAAFGSNFHAITLVRSPFDRARTLRALFTKYEIMLTPEDFTVKAASLLSAIIAESSVARVVKMEDITTDPSALGKVVFDVTGLHIPYGVARGFVESRDFRYSRAGDPLTVGERARILEHLDPDALDIYKSLGYDMNPYSEDAGVSLAHDGTQCR